MYKRQVGNSLIHLRRLVPLPVQGGTDIVPLTDLLDSEQETTRKVAISTLLAVRPIVPEKPAAAAVNSVGPMPACCGVAEDGVADEECYDSVLDTWLADVQVTRLYQFLLGSLEQPVIAATASAAPPLLVRLPTKDFDPNVHQLEQVVVIVRDEGSCLFLERDAEAKTARGDGSALALPSLRTTQELGGLYRAQHALQMLFGPVRAFPECAGLHSKLRLVDVVSRTV